MSWYSDGEHFDEYDPPYCERCRRTDVSYEVCKQCVRMHNEEDEEEDEEEEEEGGAERWLTADDVIARIERGAEGASGWT